MLVGDTFQHLNRKFSFCVLCFVVIGSTCKPHPLRIINRLSLYSVEQVNNLREIQALRRLNPHPNVIELKEVIL